MRRIAREDGGSRCDLAGSPAALVLIDMQHGFVDEGSSLCIAGARATIPACARALDKARAGGMAVVYALRRYAADGSDVEACRLEAWSRDRALSSACSDPASMQVVSGLAPRSGDVVLYKPRYSAFFATGLDMLLRRRGIETVVLAGTTTPNCVRATCYDALSLDYNAVVLADCTSSRTAEVQRANLEDMEAAGACVIDCTRFETHGLAGLPDHVRAARTFARAAAAGDA